jgi:hypothetical protein
MDDPPVAMQLGGKGMLSPYQHFASWPPPADEFESMALLLRPRGTAQYGQLARSTLRGDGVAAAAVGKRRYREGPRVRGEAGESGGAAAAAAVAAAGDKISFHKGGELGTGFFVLADIFKSVMPITAALNKVEPAHGVVYMSDALGDARRPTRLCGVPSVTNLTVTPSAAQFQIMAFLYAVPPEQAHGKGTTEGRLITHATRTVWADEGAKPGEPFLLEALGFHTCCWDLEPGHRVALGLSMHDYLYMEPCPNHDCSPNLTVAFSYLDERPPTLHLPVAK